MTIGNLGHNFAPVEWVSSGWQNLRHKASDALTHFKHEDAEKTTPAATGPGAEAGEEQTPGTWGLLAMEAIEHKDHFDLRVEAPGLSADDLTVEIVGAYVRVAGTKRTESTHSEGEVLFTERAFGRFERMVPLPANTTSVGATASYDNGVLTVKLPKADTGGGHAIPVTRVT